MHPETVKPPSLVVMADDLMFAARVRALAARLGVPARLARTVQEATVDPKEVVVLQITLHPERQLALVQDLLSRKPAPVVIAVSGHLETDLRRRAKQLGAVLASNSDLGSVLARTLGLSPRRDQSVPHHDQSGPRHAAHDSHDHDDARPPG